MKQSYFYYVCKTVHISAMRRGSDFRTSYVRKPTLYESLNGKFSDILMIYYDDGLFFGCYMDRFKRYANHLVKRIARSPFRLKWRLGNRFSKKIIAPLSLLPALMCAVNYSGRCD